MSDKRNCGTCTHSGIYQGELGCGLKDINKISSSRECWMAGFKYWEAKNPSKINVDDTSEKKVMVIINEYKGLALQEVFERFGSMEIDAKITIRKDGTEVYKVVAHFPDKSIDASSIRSLNNAVKNSLLGYDRYLSEQNAWD